MSEPAPTLHFVDDDAPLRKALTRVLRLAGHDVREYASAGDFLLADDWRRHGCILLDLRLPGTDGHTLCQAIARREDAPPIVFLSGHGALDDGVRAMKAGAFDFLTKPVDRKRLLGVVAAALEADRARRAAGRERAAVAARLDALTPRERAIFDRVVAGKLNKEIAFELAIALRTVKAHRASMMDKLGVGSVPELVRFAAEAGGVPARVDGGSARRS